MFNVGDTVYQQTGCERSGVVSAIEADSGYTIVDVSGKKHAHYDEELSAIPAIKYGWCRWCFARHEAP